MTGGDPNPGFVSGLADLRSGTLLGATGNTADPTGLLVRLSRAAPALLSGRRGPVGAGASRSRVVDELDELLLFAGERVHVLLRLPSDPCLALVGFAPRRAHIGQILFEARSSRDRCAASMDAGGRIR